MLEEVIGEIITGRHEKKVQTQMATTGISCTGNITRQHI